MTDISVKIKRVSIFVIAFLLLGMTMMRFSFGNEGSDGPQIKDPNVSGQFYSADPDVLGRDVEEFLKAAEPFLQASGVDVPMIIAPHAGYVYSGAVAGHSFKAVAKEKPKTVIILAPSHFFGFDGASIWPKGGFKTPLGIAAVDEEFAKRLSAEDSKFGFQSQAFEKEHALEVEIPFLQKTFTDFKIVPVILGQMSFETCVKFAVALDKVIGRRTDVLIVVSSDMSHYHDSQSARTMDQGTLEIIKSLDAKELYRQCVLRNKEMCGFVPVTTALLLAQKRGWSANVLKYAHSGDVTGDNNRVVGYGSIIFAAPAVPQAPQKNDIAPLNQQQKQKLLDIAKEAIATFVTRKEIPDVRIEDQRLSAPEGAFVSIYKKGQLRGCIGHIISAEPLQKTVRDVAISSATQDPRFNPVTVEELGELDLEISVLSKPWRITDVAQIEMGEHGVIVRQGSSRGGVFLPQVATETGWSKDKFLSELCSQKAGLPSDCWKDPATAIEIFTADVFKEKDIH